MSRVYVKALGAVDGSPDIDREMSSEEADALDLPMRYPMVSIVLLTPITCEQIYAALYRKFGKCP